MRHPDFLSINPDNYPDGEKPVELPRRKFIKKAIAAGLGLAALGQNGNNINELEASKYHEAEERWEFWRDRLLASLGDSMAYFRDIDIDAVATREHAAYQAKEEGDLSRDYFRNRAKEFAAAAVEDFAAINSLLDELQHIGKYKHIIPALENALTTYKSDIKEQDSIFHSVLIGGTKGILTKVVTAHKVYEEYGVSIKGTSKSFFNANIEAVYADFRKVPPFTVRRANIGTITLEEVSIGAGSANPFSGMALNVSSAIEGTPMHELVHHLDFLSKTFWKFWEDDKDALGWSTVNSPATPYRYSSGAEAILRKKYAAYSEVDLPHGYADIYGWEGGIWEDKATVGAGVFDSSNLQRLIAQAAIDAVLKNKLELFTGYKLDTPYRLHKWYRQWTKDELDQRQAYASLISKEDAALVSFGMDGKAWPGEERKTADLTRRALHEPDFIKAIEYHTKSEISVLCRFGNPLSDEDFKKNGFQERDYWSQWSKDDAGRVWMDADYYNAILDGKRVTFEERNGETVRMITPAHVPATDAQLK